MASYLITQKELDLLYEKPWSAQMTYFRGLRPRMDYATGVVGLKCGISRQMIKEELTVPSIQGRHLDAYHQPSTKEIRYALEVLEECGLIERIEAGKKLVFRMPYAAVGNSVQNMKGRSGAEQKNHINNKINHDEAAMKDRHLVSGKIEVLDTNSYTEASAPASVASPSKPAGVQAELLPPVAIDSGKQERKIPSPPSAQQQASKTVTAPKRSTAPVWEAYRQAYLERYGVDPIRNATINGQLAHLVRRLGEQESPEVARYYLGLETPLYHREGHSVGMLLKHAEHLRTLWARGHQSGPPGNSLGASAWTRNIPVDQVVVAL